MSSIEYRYRCLREALHGIVRTIRYGSGYTWSYRWFRFREALTLNLSKFYAAEDAKQ